MLKFCQRLKIRAFGGSLAALLYVVLQLFASSPELHHLLHADANQPNHQCAIKLLSDGQVDVVSHDAEIRVPDLPLVAAISGPFVALVRVDIQLPLGRAPPFFPS